MASGKTVNYTIASVKEKLNENIHGIGDPVNTEQTSFDLWTLEYYLLAIMLGTFSLVGTLGNIPVLLVYLKRKERMAANTFIKVLACVDLNVCALVMPYTIFYEMHLVTSDVFCRSLEFLRHFAIAASNLALVAIAVERYIAVCRITRKLSVQNVNYGMCAIIFASLVTAAPSVATFAVVGKEDVEDVPCRIDHNYINGKFCHFTYSIMGLVGVTVYQGIQMILFCLTFLIIVVCYIVVYVVLWKKVKTRKKMLNKDFSNCSEQKSSVATTPRPSCDRTDDIRLEQETRLIRRDTDEGISSSHDASLPQSPIKIQIDKAEEIDDIQSSNRTRNISLSSTHAPNMTSDDNQRQNGTRNLSLSSTHALKMTPALKRIKFSFSGRSVTAKRKRRFHRRTAKMLFLCTVIYLVTWLPFWFDIFGLTHSLLLRYLFFLGNASNPIVYGIVNEQVRRDFRKWLRHCFGKWFCATPSRREDSSDAMSS